ncbi:HNH endonuclease [Microbacterium karelineae]|uniref:HNH endonuclease n=1 Tax=Microbacterium karelineae TaxID=2654283 RepID=UPI0012E9FD58|nr:hypothetical protein [Microbacterium karelineae]
MTVTVRTKKAVIERDGGFCLLMLPGCIGEAQTTDHRANRGAGGTPRAVLDHPANLISACSLCNGAKADAHEFVLDGLERRGLYIRKAATNAETLEIAKSRPVEAIDGSLWLLVSATKRVPYELVMSEVPF